MGKEWYNWGGRSTTTSRRVDRESPGCMSSVLHLFDFQQFQFSITHQPCFKPNSVLQDDPTIIKGTEAPRNSLESEEGIFIGASSLSAELKEEDSYIPIEIRIPTKAAELSSSSETSSSPGAKTPNLVARLMGLEILPDSFSPSSSSSLNKTHHELYSREQNGVQFRRPIQRKTNKNNNKLVEINEETRLEITGSRSLPETPRISSARRSDVDSRLSLQINKENLMVSEEFDYLSRVSREHKLRKRDWRFDEENRSPSHYSRQIVKQVKENLIRKVGLDITNTTPTTIRRCKSTDGDSHSLTLKSKKPKRATKIREESSPSKHSTTPSCSPRLRFLEIKSKTAVSTSPDQISHSPRPLSKPKSQTLPKHQTIEKCKKASCERFTQRRESFVHQPSKASKANLKISEKKCKKSPLSNDVVALHTQSRLPLQQVAQASKPNSRLSSCSSQGQYDQPLDDRDDRTKRTGSVTEFRWYVSEILKCTGIYRDTHVSFTRWFSLSHPLDPSVFHLLEHSSTPTINGFLRHRWNRRLIFNLVDEILVEILRPYINMKPWIISFGTKKISWTRGDRLLQRLCSEIRSFPGSNCQELQDIDALVERDLPDANVRTLPMLDETELIVFELERDILDSLVHETAAAVLRSAFPN